MQSAFGHKAYLARYLVFKVRRGSLVPGLFLTFSAKVDGGKSLKKFQVSDFQIGRRLGEFALTRKPYFFPMRKKKK